MSNSNAPAGRALAGAVLGLTKFTNFKYVVKITCEASSELAWSSSVLLFTMSSKSWWELEADELTLSVELAAALNV